MHTFKSNFQNNRFTTSRKHFREHSRLMFFRKFVQGIMSLANLRKGVSYLERGAKKMYVHHRQHRNCVERWNTRVRSLCLLYNSSFFVFFVCISPKCFFWLSDVTLFETVRVEARDFYRMIVQRSGITVRINKTKTICILPSNSAVCKIKVLLPNAWLKAKTDSTGKFLSLNFVWRSWRLLSAESHFS